MHWIIAMMFVLLAGVASAGCRSEQLKANEGSLCAKQATAAATWLRQGWTGGVACPQTQVSAKQATAASCSPLAPSNLYDPCSTSFSNRQLSAKYAGKPDGYSVQV